VQTYLTITESAILATLTEFTILGTRTVLPQLVKREVLHQEAEITNAQTKTSLQTLPEQASESMVRPLESALMPMAAMNHVPETCPYWPVSRPDLALKSSY